MKKLMIAAAIVCAAAFAQAATVSWGISSLMTPTAGTGAYTSTGVGSGATMSVFLVDADTYGKLTFDQTFYNTYSAESADYTGKTSMSNKTLESADKYNTGDHVYAAILLTYNDGKDTWFVANKADVVIAEFDGVAQSAEITKLNTKQGGTGGIYAGGDITGWTKVQAVPEPTSGLLLLLGMAGLALRRRRA